MSCLGRAAVPVKRVWRGLSARLRRRRATGKPSSSSYTPMDRRREPSDGLGRLRKDVRTCEYSDVHVMWEMLSTISNGDAMGAGGGGGAIAAGGAAAGKGSRRGGRVGRKAASPPTAARSDPRSRAGLLIGFRQRGVLLCFFFCCCCFCALLIRRTVLGTNQSIKRRHWSWREPKPIFGTRGFCFI
ncbi:unnamed protein product [Urochloa humidicola]